MTRIIQEVIPGGKAHVVGHSVGAQMVVEMLATQPEVMLSALVSSAQVIALPGYRLGLYSEPAMAAIYWLGIAPWKGCDAWIRWQMQQSSGIPARYFQRFKQNFQGLTPDLWAHVMAQNFAYRLPGGLDKANVRTLLVAGTQEKIDIHPSHRILAGEIRDCQSVQLGADRRWSAAQEHNWPMSDPELFARTVRAWVNEQPLPQALVKVYPGA
jgi:pimeloyl-ACP methyl ester carboxylesterase